MLTLILKIFDVVRDHGKRKSDSQRQCVEDIFAFYSDSEAAMIRVFLALERDGTGDRSESTMNQIVNLSGIDAIAQRLQLRVRTAFFNTEIPNLVFELLRRISLAKQSLFLSEPQYIREGYFADRKWIEYQLRRTIASAAKAANIDITNPECPFLIGFDAASDFPLDNSDSSGQPPSAKIAYDYRIKKVRAQWEAAGHTWDGALSALDKYPELDRRVKTSDAEDQSNKK